MPIKQKYIINLSRTCSSNIQSLYQLTIETSITHDEFHHHPVSRSLYTCLQTHLVAFFSGEHSYNTANLTVEHISPTQNSFISSPTSSQIFKLQKNLAPLTLCPLANSSSVTWQRIFFPRCQNAKIVFTLCEFAAAV